MFFVGYEQMNPALGSSNNLTVASGSPYYAHQRESIKDPRVQLEKTVGLLEMSL